MSKKCKIDLLTDNDVVLMFETSIRGGLTSVVKSHFKCNIPDTAEYDPTKPIRTAAFLDVNSLYGNVLSKKLPVNSFRELSEREVDDFKSQIEGKDCNGEYAYALCIDFDIPEEAQIKTDYLPMSLCQMEIGMEHFSEYTKNLIKDRNQTVYKQKTLVATHLPQERYMIALPLLKMFMGLGMNVTKVHRVLSFKQNTPFKGFIEKNAELRKNTTSSFEKTLYKLLSNSIYGKLLFNARKNCIKTELVTRKERLNVLSSDFRLREAVPIDTDKVLMKTLERKIKLNYPQYMGWWVLEMSKLHMYDFYYNVLKKKMTKKKKKS